MDAELFGPARNRILHLVSYPLSLKTLKSLVPPTMAALNLNLQRLCNLLYELLRFVFGERYGMFYMRQYNAV